MNALIEAMPWIPALGWALLHFLWQGAMVGGVFALLRALIPKHQCNARYVNGLVALLALAALPLATFLRLQARHAAPIEVMSSVDAASLAPGFTAGAVDALGAAPFDHALLTWIVALWLAGVVLVGVRSWHQWRALVRVARRWATPDDQLQEMVAALARRFEFVRRIRVLVSDRVDTPTLIGWIKPVILLPTAVAIGFPRQQLELILAHELGHLRRYDHLVNLAQVVLETVLFYHPVVHWVANEVRNEREICCDALVLRVTRGEPREYAGTLAALEELRQAPVRLALAASGGVLLERVRRILFAPHADPARTGLRIWIPALALVVVALGATLRIERREPVAVDGPLLAVAAIAPEATLALATSASAHLGRIARPRFALLPLPRSETSPAAAATPVSALPPSPSAALPPAIAAANSTAGSTTPAPAPDAAPPAVTDAGAPQAPSLAQIAATTLSRPAPVAMRTAAPEYPPALREADGARVELMFSITPAGRVHDIAVVPTSGAERAFVRAAERALQQWRFDPATVPEHGATRYRQAFVFSPRATAEDASAGCVRRTGSLLCQRTDNVGADKGEDGQNLVAAMAH